MNDKASLLAFVAVLGVSIAGCESSEGPAERAGKQIDEATEQAGEQINQAVEETGEAIEEAGDKIREETTP